MKLLFISPVGVIGGAERILLECVRQVRTLRPAWSVTVLMFADGPLREAATLLGANVEIVPLPSELAASGDSQLISAKSNPNVFRESNSTYGQSDSPSPLPENGAKGEGMEYAPKKRTLWHRRFFATKLSAMGFFWKLRKAIHRIRPDLIHSNGLKSHLCMVTVQPRDCPVLWHIHDYYSHRPKIHRIVRLASRRATACIAISSSVQDDIQSVAPKLTTHLLENGVDTEYFVPGKGDSVELDRQAGFLEPTSWLRVGLVATYANWKGHDVFLQAVACLPHVRAYIVGGPIYTTAGSQWSEAELRKKAFELGIVDRVGFISFQSDPCWIYRSLDIVVHASTRPEPFGLTIVEAMACGRPVVVAAAGGAKSLFTDGWDAIGHEPGNSDSLAKTIQQLADNVELRRQIGERGRQSAVDRFSTTRFGEKLIEIYEQVAVKAVGRNKRTSEPTK